MQPWGSGWCEWSPGPCWGGACPACSPLKVQGCIAWLTPGGQTPGPVNPSRRVPAATGHRAPRRLHAPRAALSPPASHSLGELGVSTGTTRSWKMAGSHVYSPACTPQCKAASQGPGWSQANTPGLRVLACGTGAHTSPWELCLGRGEQPKPPRPCRSALGALPEASLDWGGRQGIAETHGVKSPCRAGWGGEVPRLTLAIETPLSEIQSFQWGDVSRSCWEPQLWGKGQTQQEAKSHPQGTMPCPRQHPAAPTSITAPGSEALGCCGVPRQALPCGAWPSPQPGRPPLHMGLQPRLSLARSQPSLWPKAQGLGNRKCQITAGAAPPGQGHTQPGGCRAPRTPSILHRQAHYTPAWRWPSPHRPSWARHTGAHPSSGPCWPPHALLPR